MPLAALIRIIHPSTHLVLLVKRLAVEAQQQQGYVVLLAEAHQAVRRQNQNLVSKVGLAALLEVAVTDLAVELLAEAVVME